tara:strand:- start:358 stop:939 length:582 start_codon:yes stop_codon:yes gene_type:complete
METITITLTGASPLLMHSARGSNPLDKATIAHKALTATRKKTEDHHRLIAESEWHMGMYYDDKLGPYIPTMNIRSSLIGGAKFSKLGATVKRSTLVTEQMTRLDYIGPRTPEAMFADGNFVSVESVKVGQARLMRTRPLFRDWSLTFELLYDPEQIERAQVIDAFESAGKLIGIGDFRPECGGMYGRYSVTAH